MTARRSSVDPLELFVSAEGLALGTTRIGVRQVVVRDWYGGELPEIAIPPGNTTAGKELTKKSKSWL